MFLVDALIINSIEFWSGNNPVSGAGAQETSHTVRLSPTDTLRMSRAPDTGVMRLALEREGQEPVVRYFEPLEDGMAVHA